MPAYTRKILRRDLQNRQLRRVALVRADDPVALKFGIGQDKLRTFNPKGRNALGVASVDPSPTGLFPARSVWCTDAPRGQDDDGDGFGGTIVIDLGAEFCIGDDGKVLARMGPVVKDLRGNLLVLTSREAMECGQTVYARTESGLVAVGERRDDFFPQGDREDAAVRLAAWFYPLRGDAITPLSSKPLRVASEDELLLKEVVIGDGSSRGFVSRVNWFVNCALDGRAPGVAYRGLLRVTSSEVGSPIVTSGVSGAPVLTTDGALVGIVVGAMDGDAVVVPLGRILRSEQLALATDRAPCVEGP